MTAIHSIDWRDFRQLDTWAAIDFETANPRRASVCAVGIVRVDCGRITARHYATIRPAADLGEFTLSWVHGLTLADVEHSPRWPIAWQRIRSMLAGVTAVAAHNSAFDRSALLAACKHYGQRPPSWRWLDTVKLSRQLWKIRPTRLPDVCAALEIPLTHHDASSDAEAVARIVAAAHAVEPPGIQIQLAA